MRMTDQGDSDDKIIAVAQNDVSVNYINDIYDLPSHTIVEMQRFFEDYKKLENKKVVIEKFMNKAAALAIVNESIELYNTTFPA